MDDSRLNSIGRSLYGRKQIFTSAVEITEENVLSVVNDALSVHFENAADIDYLYWYRRGVQPILKRRKEIRPEINNRVVVNNADAVCTFKNGYFLTKPAFYVSRVEDEKVQENVKSLNEFLYTSGKSDIDNQVVDWFHTVGVGIILVEPSRDGSSKKKPVSVYCLDPRNAFVVYSLQPGHRPMFSVNFVVDQDKTYFDVFTDKNVYRLIGGDAYGKSIGSDRFMPSTATSITKVESNVVGVVPMVEYTFNSNRMGSFEAAIPLMDAINVVQSNRLDGIEQAVQQLCIAYNCEFEDGVTANEIRKAGMISLKSTGETKADFKIIDSYLDQSATQTTCEDLYRQMLEKCGVPSTSPEQRSSSDNTGAVYLRAGWQMADTHARNTEDLFKRSNRYFDEIFLRIVAKRTGIKVDVEDFELCFIRNDMNNLLVKTQAAMNMKDLGFSPELALERSGLSSDPITDVARSQKYMDAVWEPIDDTEIPMEGEAKASGFNGSAVKSENEVQQDAAQRNAREREASPTKKSQGNWVSGYWR